jgi:hypothetical protein
LHHTGSHEVTSVAVHEEPEEQPEVQEQEVPEADEEVGEDLPKCPDHRPSKFRERQAPEHFLPWFANILLMLYFN